MSISSAHFQQLLELLNQYTQNLLTQQQRDVLVDYLQLLVKWNRAYNLTAILEPREMVTHHILDSLSIVSYLHGKRIIDVGTGAGLPGIPLAVVCPEREFVLLDSNGKKCRFLFEVKQQLKLTNVAIVHDRAENYRPSACFDSVVSRAFSSLAQMLKNTQHLCCEDGIFVAMKGVYPKDELAQITVDFTVDPIKVTGLNEQRHVVRIKYIK